MTTNNDAIKAISAEEWLFGNVFDEDIDPEDIDPDESVDLPEIWPEGKTLEECVAECENAVDSDQLVDGDFEEAILERANNNYMFAHNNKLLPHHILALVDHGYITCSAWYKWVCDHED